MALLAEELVEEWLNRDGFFTIRGLKLGVAEIDLLAVKFDSGNPICRHIEVQASVNPISYICPLPKTLQASTGRPAYSAADRSLDHMRQAVDGWIHKKFRHPKKATVRQRLCPGTWSEEFVVNVAKHEVELEEIARRGIKVHRLPIIIQDLLKPPNDFSAVGRDLVDLLVRPALDRRRTGPVKVRRRSSRP